MQDSTFAALLSRALHPATGTPEATASIGRILAHAEARAELQRRIDHHRPSACPTCEHNRSELQRAVAEVTRLRGLLEAAQAATDPASNSGQAEAPGAGPRRSGSRRPRSVVELEVAATCYDCGAGLAPGDLARVYPGGRVYGTECHGRRARA